MRFEMQPRMQTNDGWVAVPEKSPVTIRVRFLVFRLSLLPREQKNAFHNLGCGRRLILSTDLTQGINTAR